MGSEVRRLCGEREQSFGSIHLPFFLLLFSFHLTLFLPNFIFTLSSQQWLPFFFAATATYWLALCSVRSLHLSLFPFFILSLHLCAFAVKFTTKYSELLLGIEHNTLFNDHHDFLLQMALIEYVSHH